MSLTHFQLKPAPEDHWCSKEMKRRLWSLGTSLFLASLDPICPPKSHQSRIPSPSHHYWRTSRKIGRTESLGIPVHLKRVWFAEIYASAWIFDGACVVRTRVVGLSSTEGAFWHEHHVEALGWGEKEFHSKLNCMAMYWMNRLLLNRPWITWKKFSGQRTQAIQWRFAILNRRVNRAVNRILNRHVWPLLLTITTSRI